MDSHHLKPYRLRLKNAAPLDDALPGSSEAYRRLDAAALEALDPEGPARDDATTTSPPSAASPTAPTSTRPPAASTTARPTPPSSSAPPPSSRSARSPTPARRCRRSRPSSSPSCSPGSPSTRSSRPSGTRRSPTSTRPSGARAQSRPPRSLGWPDGEDLHAQGRRRDHRPLVRRAPAEVRRADRGVRDRRRGRLRARRRALDLRRRPRRTRRSPTTCSSCSGDLFVAGAELAASPEASDRLEDGVSRVTAEMTAGRRVRDRPLHGPGRPAAEVRDPRRHAALRPARPRAGDPAPGRAPRRGAGRRRASSPPSEVLAFLNRAADLVYAMARFTDVDDPAIFEGRGRAGNAAADPAS